MNIKHKPGVLCVVIGSMTVQGRRHIGKQVELVKTVMPGEETILPEGDIIIFTGERQAWLVKGDIVSHMAKIKGYAFFQQRHLLPIKDPGQDFKDEHQHQLHITVGKGLKVVEVDMQPVEVKA